MKNALSLAVVAMLACVKAVAGQPTGPAADVVVYGHRAPQYFRHLLTEPAVPFVSPFNAQEDADPGSVDPWTRMTFETVPEMKNPFGTLQWGATTFGKYVFLGNYQNIFVVAEQKLGVYDSEEKTFTLLDVSAVPNSRGTQRVLVTANSEGRQSRIFFSGHSFVGSDQAGVGYVEANLDTPSDSWPIRFIFASELAPGFDDFDGVALLWHEEDQNPQANPFGRDWIALQGWFQSKVVVVMVDAAGPQLVATYDAVPITIAPCATPYIRRPVGRPGVDQRRGKSDIRFVASYDLPIPAFGCGKRAAVQEFQLNAETGALTPTSPVFHGTLGDSGVMSFSFDSSGGLWLREAGGAVGVGIGVYNVKTAGQTCTVNGATIAAPPGEHCYFDPAHPMSFVTVNPDVGEGGASQLRFDFPPGELVAGAWFSVQSGGYMYLNGTQSVQRARNASGTWTIDDDTAFKVSVAPKLLPSEARECSAYHLPGGANAHRTCECPEGTPQDTECSDTLHCGTSSMCSPVFRACIPPTSPFPFPTYAACECPPGTPVTEDCKSVCQNTETCHAFGEDATPRNLPSPAIGGAPSSLWLPAAYNSPMTNGVVYPHSNLFLLRLPLVSTLPDPVSSVRPALAWISGKLWLVGGHGGTLKYRVRDRGQWSTWYPLPTNVAIQGGVAAIGGNNAWVELYGRSSSGALYTSLLGNAACSPAVNCSWSPWQLVPGQGTLTTNVEPAAAYQGTVAPIVVMRNNTAGDAGKIYFVRRIFGAWSPWTAIDGIVSDRAPAVAWHPDDGTFWVVAYDTTTHTLRYRRIGANGPIGTWADVGAPGTGPVDWWSGPAIAYDEQYHYMRVLAPSTDWLFPIRQSIHDHASGSWSSWAGLKSAPFSTTQPAAVSINGDVNVVTSWFSSMQEFLAK